MKLAESWFDDALAPTNSDIFHDEAEEADEADEAKDGLRIGIAS
jgi:hypothetical protein